MSRSLVQDTSRINRDEVKALLTMALEPPASADQSTSTIFAETRSEPLMQLIADLQQPVAAGTAGPTSFARLTGLTPSECSELDGMTFIDVLTNSQVSERSLQAAVDCGELLENPIFPAATRLTGAVIRALGLLALAKRFDRSTHDADNSSILPILEALESCRSVPDNFREFVSGTKRDLLKNRFRDSQ